MSLSNEKRQEILKLLANGDITAAEAADLLADRGQSGPAPEKQVSPMREVDDLIKVEPDPAAKHVKRNQNDKPSWLRVRVSDLNSGNNKVTVNIPLRIMRFGLAVGSRFAPELEGLNWDELSDLMSAERGILVDVQDEEDGEHVQVYVD